MKSVGMRSFVEGFESKIDFGDLFAVGGFDDHDEQLESIYLL